MSVRCLWFQTLAHKVNKGVCRPVGTPKQQNSTSEARRRQTSASEAEHDEYRGGAMAFDDSFARSHADSA